LKDLQNSLRVAYRKGDTTGGSAVRGSFGNEKSSRNTNTKVSRGNR
jgi:predicted Zn-dependent protease